MTLRSTYPNLIADSSSLGGMLQDASVLSAILLALAGVGFLPALLQALRSLLVARRLGRPDTFEILLALRSPATAAAVGFLLTALGVQASARGEFLFPAFGLFTTILGALVVMKSVKLAQSIRRADYLIESERPLLLGLSKFGREADVRRFHALGSERISGYELRGHLTKNPISQKISNDRLPALDLMLILLDFVDSELWSDANIVLQHLEETSSRQTAAFWILKAVLSEVKGDQGEAVFAIREAYRKLESPPDWIADLAVTRKEHWPYMAWYSEEVRKSLFQSVLDEQRVKAAIS